MSTAKKVLLVLLIGVIVWVAYFFLYFKPKQEEIENLAARLAEVKEEMAKKQAIAADLPRFNRELEQLRLSLSQSILQLPNTKNVPELLERFGTLARDSGVRIMKFTVSPESAKGFYVELPINMELEGSYHNIAVFFDKVGKEERIINVSNVAVRTPRVLEGETVVTVNCLATTFRFLEAEAAR